MTGKFKKGYFVRGKFVAEGSELDIELKAELKGTTEQSRTDLKRESTELQKIGEQLIVLRSDLFTRLALPDKLVEALAEAKRITNFEGKRRQMQFVGKLMRALPPETLEAVKQALHAQHHGSAQESLALHEAEQWRDRLIADDPALEQWLQQHSETDAQQLRSLVRQARKDAAAPAEPSARATVHAGAGAAPRHGRAYREIFQLVRQALQPGQED